MVAGREHRRIWSTVLGVPLVLFMANLCLVLLTGWHLKGSLEAVERQAGQHVADLALVLEQALDGQVRQIDQMLQAGQDEVRHQMATGGVRTEPMQAFLMRGLQRLPMLDGLRMTDAEGVLRYGTGIPEQEPQSVADRGYFKRLQEDPKAGLVVSEPLIGRHSHHWVVVFGRRLSAPDGRFLGVLYGTVALEPFTRLLGKVDVGQKGSVSLRGPDLALWCRHPDMEQSRMTPGSTRLVGRYREAIEGGETTSQFVETSSLDGTVRRYCYRRTAAPGLHLQVGLARHEYRAGWRAEALKTLLLLGALALLSLRVGWQASRFARVQSQILRRLVEEEARYRLLTESAREVVWALDRTGQMTYVSPAIEWQRGYTVEEFCALPSYGMTAKDGSEAELRNYLEGLLVREGSIPADEERTFELQMRRKDGSTFPAEILVSPLMDAEGQLLGARGSTRDITARKAMEAQRDAVIADLTRTLAELRRLKGLLPICSHCKKVRDDQGYWSQIESYISEHSEATFSHGICPECARAFYPGKGATSEGT